MTRFTLQLLQHAEQQALHADLCCNHELSTSSRSTAWWYSPLTLPLSIPWRLDRRSLRLQLFGMVLLQHELVRIGSVCRRSHPKLGSRSSSHMLNHVKVSNVCLRSCSGTPRSGRCVPAAGPPSGRWSRRRPSTTRPASCGRWGCAPSSSPPPPACATSRCVTHC